MMKHKPLTIVRPRGIPKKQVQPPIETRPAPTIKQITSFARAMLTGTYVSEDVRVAREEICNRCEMLRTDKHGRWCGACGCGVDPSQRQISALTAYEENLPDWGCKHPKRGNSGGWSR